MSIIVRTDKGDTRLREGVGGTVTLLELLDHLAKLGNLERCGERYVATSGLNAVQEAAERLHGSPIPLELLAYTSIQVRAVLQIETTSLWRLKKKGLLRELAGLRGRYAVEEVEAYARRRKSAPRTRNLKPSPAPANVVIKGIERG